MLVPSVQTIFLGLSALSSLTAHGGVIKANSFKDYRLKPIEIPGEVGKRDAPFNPDHPFDDLRIPIDKRDGAFTPGKNPPFELGVKPVPVSVDLRMRDIIQKRKDESGVRLADDGSTFLGRRDSCHASSDAIPAGATLKSVWTISELANNDGLKYTPIPGPDGVPSLSAKVEIFDDQAVRYLTFFGADDMPANVAYYLKPGAGLKPRSIVVHKGSKCPVVLQPTDRALRIQYEVYEIPVLTNTET
ncbi:hypothetical protein PtrSN002B_008131 [Pyrenophora tritici-repentis]|uniref:Uncharacterized protein n=2 Tax=Pyrenophora tritici-repentis TaxID=45151 RepID=A0A2W1DEM1_9PLEO|nr:uncharacterized protein PTRG_11066 [Pyrenophora tritici-repentis Pt-1C-BFP]KAA8618253.1 hypothetical protein PtrV1_09760 [Pyrenophora tritici-repentis]EDU44116.1 hypothetical protein PTRG_11066 [Pyrenophora tritici-repentis Pt-1C-BFP]KAF7442787.1 hypothetical protein A1F99_122940 [Pyrenophora tritici-repentis]KAF7568760.1 hypothetical protein PtrM4_133730 [Pyrenophora tritici-repentis]KAG9376304.1 hypothetical protein A1F94_012851 [Pyrenophora tritici-repentis]